ncbi:CDC48 family AAA ATPase [Halodesulfurarchaeum formicicum]|uniref:Cell division control protein 48 n=1 Tax=Halodesulfurarchaeum formicicum TaxID=1873524 RepID=A0A1J1ABP6_9EURY|nr:CDC48 family AAA ATPase [Halodesulfurarchaeum formicicum]APE95219.1 cell division control protein 48 [Halodesulfurarchaeum formicicum]
MSGTPAIEAVLREAQPRDAGQGVIRLSRAAMRELGVLSGESVRIVGAETTVARVWPGRSDLGPNELRADGELRANAGVAVGDRVKITPVELAEADSVTLVPTADPGVDPGTLEQAVGRRLRNRSLRTSQQVKVDSLGEFRVTATDPTGPVRVTEETVVHLGAAEDAAADVGVTYEDIGGLDDELAAVRELIEAPLSEPELFQRLGIDAPKGVLLFGPPGTGKTRIARAVANEADAHFISISGPEIVTKYKGESEQRIRSVFEEAREQAPSVIFFDELDAIAGKRDDGGDMENRIVAQLLSELDGLAARGEVVVIGATNRVDAIDPALRRPGRFDREVEIGVPDREGREEILHIHTRGMPLTEDVDIPALAERTHGFVGADLQALVVEAAMVAMGRYRDDEAELSVTRQDFEAALSAVEPSAMREFVAEMPATSFADIGGLEDVKQALREAVEWPRTHRELFEATSTDPPSGILLYGPPGTGKTMLARAVASESGVNFIRVAGPELFDRYVGESERAVRELFERARQAAPTVVFLDELDAIAGRRGDTQEVTERVVSQLLTELDGAAADPNLIVLGATNRLEAIDPALRRPGRLERQLLVPEPGREARLAILRVKTEDKPLAADVDLEALADDLAGYTGADIDALVREASMRAIREAVEEGIEDGGAITVTPGHFEAAIAAVDPDGTGGRENDTLSPQHS